MDSCNELVGALWRVPDRGLLAVAAALLALAVELLASYAAFYGPLGLRGEDQLVLGVCAALSVAAAFSIG